MRSFLLPAVVLCLLLVSCTDSAQQQKEEEIERISDAVSTLHQQSGIAGLSLAVVKDFEIACVEHRGFANVATEKPITDETVFEAASLSKVVFAYIVLQLVDEGTIDLNQPLLSYVEQQFIEENFLEKPLEDERFRKLTLHDVLTHTTGLPNWRFFDGRDAPLAFRRDPGMQFGYSGEGFMLAQTVIEDVTGKPLQQLAEEYVFTPLEMKNSSFEKTPELRSLLAVRTSSMGQAREPGEDQESPAMSAASLLTTTSDFARFLIAIGQGTGLSESTSEYFFTPQVAVSEDEANKIHWGLGVGLAGNTPSAPIWHWGDNGDTKGFFYFDHEEGDGFVYFANDHYGLSVYADIMELLDFEPQVFEGSGMLNYSQWDEPSARMAMLLRIGETEAALELQRLLMEDDEKAVATESQVNRLGYQLLQLERYEDAIKLFTINAEFNPESANVWDSLAEAYWRSGDLEQAKFYYNKALNINPDFPSAIRALKEIEEQEATEAGQEQ